MVATVALPPQSKVLEMYVGTFFCTIIPSLCSDDMLIILEYLLILRTSLLFCSAKQMQAEREEAERREREERERSRRAREETLRARQEAERRRTEEQHSVRRKAEPVSQASFADAA